METGKKVRRLCLGAALSALAVAGTLCTVPQEAQAYEYKNHATNWSYPNFKRVQGNTALGTMKQAALEGWGESGSEWAVICRLDGWHDALSASRVAGLLGAPVLTTDKGSLSGPTKTALQKLGVEKAVIAGGEEAMSKTVEKQVQALGVETVRVGGNTAAGTALKMHEFGKAHGGWSSTCAVATSGTFQDALSIASYAYARRCPVFLASAKADGTARALSQSAERAVANGGFTRTLVLGGAAAVDSSVDARVPGAERLAGGTAYGTSAKVASFAVSEGMSVRYAGVATGKGYWDALCGGALCGKKGSVLVLSDEGHTAAVEKVLARHKDELGEEWLNNDDGTTSNAAKAAKTRWSYIFGGTEAVSSEALNPLENWNEKTQISSEGERLYLEKCYSCGMIFTDALENYNHMEEKGKEWDERILFSGKITVDQLEGANGAVAIGDEIYLNYGTAQDLKNCATETGGEIIWGCGRWVCTYFEVKGGTKIREMENGMEKSSDYCGDGTIVREL